MPTPLPRVAVIGTGVIGRSWLLVFARAGCETRAHDNDSERMADAFRWLKSELDRAVASGETTRLNARACWSRVTVCRDLRDALIGVDYVQENGPEAIETKRSLFAELDRNAPSSAVLASSTSTHDMSTIADGLEGAWRCIVAHPVNPPHVIPVVEVLPGVKTPSEVVDTTLRILTRVGQKPVLLRRYAPGFMLNRMQAALVREAVSLVESGVADVDAVDAVIRDGLGLRWALLGPFGVANTNADGGIRQYFQRYAGSFRMLMDDLGPTPSLDSDMIERLGMQTDEMENDSPVHSILEWRDRLIREIRQLKDDEPHPGHAMKTPETLPLPPL